MKSSPDASKLLDMTILVVDDEPGFLEIFTSLLEVQGYSSIKTASNVRKALDKIFSREPVDLVLTDMNMPVMSGYDLLRKIKSDPRTENISVIMISGAGQLQNVIHCITEGAEDFLMKPVEQQLLWARVSASLERKYLKDEQTRLYKELDSEKKKSERVLNNVLPSHIAEKLRQGETNIAESVPEASVLFTDMVSFTKLSSEISADRLVGLLNLMFLTMDHMLDRYKLEKIKTIGDSYMCASGLELGEKDHAQRIVDFAFAVLREISILNATLEFELNIRIGIASGPVISGIVGHTRPMLDVWGQTVNMASRMESNGIPGRIQITDTTYHLLEKKEEFEIRELINVKGVGSMQSYISVDGED